MSYAEQQMRDDIKRIADSLESLVEIYKTEKTGCKYGYKDCCYAGTDCGTCSYCKDGDHLD